MAPDSTSAPVAASACLNCGATLPGRFCSACGQPSSTRRLRLRDLAADALDQWIGVDGRIGNTLRGLTLRPGTVCRDYIDGRRAAYVPPLRYCATVLLVVIVANLALGNDLATVPGTDAFSARQQAVFAATSSTIQQHLDLVVFLALPLFAAVLRLLFAGCGRSYAECGVVALYLVGHTMLLALLLAPWKSAHPQWVLLPRLALQSALLAWASIAVFGVGPLRAVLSGIAASIGYLLLVMLVVLLLALPGLLPMLASG